MTETHQRSASARRITRVKTIPVLCKDGNGLIGNLARPEIFKTAFGRRLREVRRLLGDPDREVFAETLGVTARSLATYERGDNEPSSSVLGAYRDAHGVNLNWLLSDKGEVFADPAEVPKQESRPLDEMLMRSLAQIAIRAHRQAQLVLRHEDIAVEAASLYNELKEKADDIDDAEEVAQLLPWLEGRLNKRLAKLKADPANVPSKRA